jgi:ribosomal protein S12 methylthiotransferase
MVKNMRIHLTTLGCAKNLYDSEILMGQLTANKVILMDNPHEADVIIINTCGFIKPAKQESIEAILEAVQIKKHQSGLKLLVCGCLSKRYNSELKRELPEVDAFFGTEDFTSIINYLGLTLKSPEHLYEKRYLSQNHHFAYLKISEGCNHKCAFCAIPLMRGRYKSRSMQSIVEEGKILAARGVVELILIAQDTTSYGVDLYNKQCIVELLQQLEMINGIRWIRLHYGYPTTFPTDLAVLISGSRKILPYIDLPIQHISDNVLIKMKRGSSSEKIKNLLNTLRKQIPEVTLRTTLIVGHPGETRHDFKQLEKFVTEFEFDRLGVFQYSAEENTPAYDLPAPSKKTTQARYEKIMEIQRQISLKKNRTKIGNIINVLVDEIENEHQTAIGRTMADSPEIDNLVFVKNISENTKPGDFLSVKVSDANEYELFGQIAEDV